MLAGVCVLLSQLFPDFALMLIGGRADGACLRSERTDRP